MLLQRQGPSLRALTTAHLAQTMTLLELTAVELREKIEAELSSNPALELVDEKRCPSCRRVLVGRMACPVCSRPHNLSAEEPIVFVSQREDFFTYRGSREGEYTEDAYSQTAGEETLAAFVLRQIAPELETADRPIAAHILTSLDEDGLLPIPILEIARYHHVPISRVETVLHLVQRAEPVGVGSPTPREALLVQLEVLGETHPVPSLADRAIREGWQLLSRRRHQELGRLLNVSTRRIQEITRFIGENLNPYPARAHWGDIGSTSQTNETRRNTYYFPDIIISQLNDGENNHLVVEVALPFAGSLRLNPLFKEAIHEAPEEKSEQWRSDMEKAQLLVKCIQQRNNTMVRLMEFLVRIQRDFILHGNAHLQPLTRASLSTKLGVHESTISRAVSGKAVQLPNGHMIPLALFFDRSLHVRTALRRLIEQESSPLSDQEIGAALAEQGFCVARRTVAKYRSMEGILPAHLRSSIGPT
jgi:RNA polymerase sigma-54 factor